MKVRYHIATISFCTNLTTAESDSIPVGILMVGTSDQHAMALLAVREDHGLLDSLPPLIRSIVKDFPQMLQAQLEEILASADNGSIDNVMRVFEESLRNSFFVSDLRWNQEFDVPGATSARDEPWRAAYPSVVMAASERMVAAHVTPDEVRQHFKPWIHRHNRHEPVGLG
jgi:hypothetical protein